MIPGVLPCESGRTVLSLLDRTEEEEPVAGGQMMCCVWSMLSIRCPWDMWMVVLSNR